MDKSQQTIARRDYERAAGTLRKLINLYPNSSLNYIYEKSLKKYEKRISELSQ